MLIATVFTIVKLCNQPKCPTTDEWTMRCEREVGTVWGGSTEGQRGKERIPRSRED
jgi:hypothetical protein